MRAIWTSATSDTGLRSSPTTAVWSRVAGDVLDLVFPGCTLANRNNDRGGKVAGNPASEMLAGAGPRLHTA